MRIRRDWLASMLLLIPVAVFADAVRICTDSGPVQGVRDGSIVVYKGIPFAAPPIGDLRWRAPQPAPRWDKVLKADAYKSQCMQLGPPLPTMPEETSSEDCLYLNLWAPAGLTDAKRPVMVWFYGGSFRRGSASTPLYWGDELARNRDVIVVTVNYRVGPLGFLVHPELTAESGYQGSGNYGLMDAVAGLQWVQRNAAAFGGDPQNVTIFGQSAGAWVVNKLMVSALARGLFHKAIAQSGGDMGPTRTREGRAVLSDAEKSGVAFATSLGAASIAELRRTSAETITAARFESLPGIPQSNAALPIVDGYVIPRDTYALYAAGKQADIPLLIGYNADEGAYGFEPVETAVYLENIRKQFGVLADEFLALYPATPEVESARSQARLWAESTFGWQSWVWARVHAQTSRSKVFFYHFSMHRNNGHGAELPYVFQHPFGGPWRDGERDIAETISTYWTNFARTGDPNGAGLPRWPAFGANSETAMHIGKSFEAAEVPDLPMHRLMDAYMNSLRDGATADEP